MKPKGFRNIQDELDALKRHVFVLQGVLDAVVETVTFKDKVYSETDDGMVIHDGDVKKVWMDGSGIWQEMKPAQIVKPINPETDGN